MHQDTRVRHVPNRLRTVRYRAGALAAVGMAGALVLAACGSSGSKSATNPTPSSSGSSQTSSQGAATVKTSPTVVVSVVPKYGKILTNAKGFALYVYTADSPGKSGCSGLCLKIWPALLLPSGQTTPVAGAGVSGLGTLQRSEGTQVTLNGLPLYTYVPDTEPHEVTGQDVKDPGGIWYLATPSGPLTSTSTTTGSSSATSTAANAASGAAGTATQGSSQPAATTPQMPQPASGTPATHTPATQTPVTQAPVTQPPVTQPPVTQPVVTSPPTTPPTTAPGGGVSY